MKINEVYNMDCLEGMKLIPDGSVDLVVTSPPYDNLRKYGGIGEGWNFETFKAIANELTRILKEGGVIVWVVADATIDGSETGTSFRQALYFKDECGLNLYDTMIYRKENYVPLTHRRYEQAFEYMFVLSKGRPKAFNPIMEKSLRAFEKYSRNSHVRDQAQAFRPRKDGEFTITSEEKQHSNIFSYNIGGGDTGHPAVFPEDLAREQVYSWSNEGDTVIDPFMGSGTTAVACIKEKRNFIGFELNKDYFDKAQNRIKAEQKQLTFEF